LAEAQRLPERWILLPDAGRPLRTLAKPQGELALLVGAEGGFTQGEQDAALAQGFTPIQLGPRVLRTETAGLAALAAIQALWGDF
jgi:16S rRNA (uracil1498-N3)-methyltransferase